MPILAALGTAVMLMQLADSFTGGNVSGWVAEKLGYGGDSKESREKQQIYMDQLLNTAEKGRYETEATQYAFNFQKQLNDRLLGESQYQFRAGLGAQREANQLGAQTQQFGSVMGAMPQLTNRDPQFAVPFNPLYPNITSLMTPGQM